MKQDISKLLERLTTDNLKPGDLVVTFEVHRLIEPFKRGADGNWLVRRVVPPCGSGCADLDHADDCMHSRVMHPGPGQHGIAKLVEPKALPADAGAKFIDEVERLITPTTDALRYRLNTLENRISAMEVAGLPITAESLKRLDSQVTELEKQKCNDLTEIEALAERCAILEKTYRDLEVRLERAIRWIDSQPR